jgi:hypothetical protein
MMRLENGFGSCLPTSGKCYRYCYRYRAPYTDLPGGGQ